MLTKENVEVPRIKIHVLVIAYPFKALLVGEIGISEVVEGLPNTLGYAKAETTRYFGSPKCVHI